MDFHPVSEIFPLMTGKPFDELVYDIRVNGLREAIWRHEGKIIDGRNRYRACLEGGVQPHYRDWDGVGDLVKLVVSLNLHRRHLNESQRSMVAANIASSEWGGGREGKCSDEHLITNNAAAELLNVSEMSVRRARKVKDHGTPALVAAVTEGKVTVTSAADLADLPPHQQDEAAAAAPAETEKKVRAIRAKKRRAEGKPEKLHPVEEVRGLIREVHEFVSKPFSQISSVDLRAKVDGLRLAFDRAWPPQER